MATIRKAAVLGAGVMGSGIAAHLASCGIRTILLDIVPPDLSDEEKDDPKARNRFAANGLKGAIKSKPALFVDKAASSLIEVGNFDDDMGRIAECDWVVEVVKEDMRIKRILLENVENSWTPGTIVTSNTSGLSIDGMLEGRSADFRKHFLGTHFFNPVRYMHLLEIIPGKETDPAILDQMADFCRRILGKGVVWAKDTPNFIANRIGVHAMMTTIHAMDDLDYSIEEVDAIVGKPMGRPKSAAFRTADMVGIDTFVHVANNCYEALPDDPERDTFKVPAFLDQMVDKGLLGQKARAGFYKKVGKQISTIDRETLEYRDKVKPDLPELKDVKKAGGAADRIKALVSGDGRAAKFGWYVLSRSLAYTANIAFDIADDVVNIDRAMRWGFNWDLGPFEVWDALGVGETAERMRADGLTVPKWVDEAAEAGGFYAEKDGEESYFAPGKGLEPKPQIPGSLSIGLLKKAGHVVEKNRGGTLVDMGDGIACVEFHTKMNTVDPDLVEILNTACDRVERDFDGLVLANEADNFSAGANLFMIVMNANQKKFDEIEQTVETFQSTVQRLKYLPKPVVSAPHGLTLGGGCEMAMAADRMIVDKETYMGLVEVGVGLIPGGCGTLNLLKRLFEGVPPKIDPREYDVLPMVQRAFMNIGMAQVATGAGEVFDLGFGTARDEIAMNRDRRDADAKALCRYLADRGYTPPKPATNLYLPGRHGAAALSLAVYGMMLGEFASEHDKKIADKVAWVLCGGDTDGRTPVDEEKIIELEREAFMSLVGEPKTLERMQYMLMNNKPLRN
ncbi:MAG: 3-hydroxyacyl-CoA dehydrogenase/enoyl-CoA hydratase family protein [Myxococcota bacterium]